MRLGSFLSPSPPPGTLMFFPISDDDRHIDSPAWVTWILLAINILLFLVQVANPDFTYGWSVIPKEITTGVDITTTQRVSIPGEGVVEIPQAPGPPVIWLTLLSSMFMHGGVGHLAGNMLYLWIFGNNVEHRFGHLWFLLFYLAAGLVGSLAQVFLIPESVIPNLGASGAIAGVMGAYLVLFPRNLVNAVFLFHIVTVPALVVLGMWIVMQLFSTVGSIASTSVESGGVAYLAHVGGFLTGVLFALPYRLSLQTEPDSMLRRQYLRDPRAKRLW